MSRIFISHASSRHTDEKAFVESLVSGLTAHFDEDAVFVDYTSIPIGSQWREHILAGLNQAQIIVAILGRDALDPAQYPWVHTELTVARWRQLLMGPANTLILPLFYGEGSKTAFNNGVQWQPFEFGQLQWLEQEFSGRQCPQHILADFIQRIEQTPPHLGQNPEQKFLAKLTRHFADALVAPMTPQDQNSHIRALITEELAYLSQLLQEQPDDYYRHQMLAVLNRLAPLWVPPQACQQLAAIKQPTPTPGKFALRSESPDFTPHCYLAQTGWLPFKQGWQTIGLEPLGQELSLGQIDDFIARELAQRLSLTYREDRSIAWLNQQFATIIQPILPTFVLIDPTLAKRQNPSVLAHLSQHWPSLHQLVLLTHQCPLPDGYIELPVVAADNGQSTAEKLAQTHYQRSNYLITHCCVPQ